MSYTIPRSVDADRTERIARFKAIVNGEERPDPVQFEPTKYPTIDDKELKTECLNCNQEMDARNGLFCNYTCENEYRKVRDESEFQGTGEPRRPRIDEIVTGAPAYQKWKKVQEYNMQIDRERETKKQGKIQLARDLTASTRESEQHKNPQPVVTKRRK